MGPNFDKIERLANGELLVEGPFETHGLVNDDVLVRIVISHDGIERYDTAIVANSALATSGTDADVISRGRFIANVGGLDLAVGDTVRAIGVSVAAKRADPRRPDPSAFETFTWCVRSMVTSE